MAIKRTYVPHQYKNWWKRKFFAAAYGNYYAQEVLKVIAKFKHNWDIHTIKKFFYG